MSVNNFTQGGEPGNLGSRNVAIERGFRGIYMYIHVLIRDERKKEERSKQDHVHLHFATSFFLSTCISENGALFT